MARITLAQEMALRAPRQSVRAYTPPRQSTMFCACACGCTAVVAGGHAVCGGCRGAHCLEGTLHAVTVPCRYA